jgi:hypothetical protein
VPRKVSRKSSEEKVGSQARDQDRIRNRGRLRERDDDELGRETARRGDGAEGAPEQDTAILVAIER